jgi:hypothetical protein
MEWTVELESFCMGMGVEWMWMWMGRWGPSKVSFSLPFPSTVFCRVDATQNWSQA